MRILLLQLFWKKQFIQVVILGAVGYTSFYAFFLPLFHLTFSHVFSEFALVAAMIAAFVLDNFSSRKTAEDILWTFEIMGIIKINGNEVIVRR